MSEDPSDPRLRHGTLSAITTVAAFLVWAEKENPDMTFGSYNVSEALEAFAHITNLPLNNLRERLLKA